MGLCTTMRHTLTNQSGSAHASAQGMGFESMRSESRVSAGDLLFDMGVNQYS